MVLPAQPVPLEPMEALGLDRNPEPSGPPIRELEYTSGYAPRMPSLSWVLFLESFVSPTCAVTSQLCKEAFSEFATGASSAPPSQVFVTAVVPKECLDWCVAVKVGSTVVGAIPPTAFTHDELLARRLAGCTVLGTVAPVSKERSVVSLRMSYRFVDSNTGGQSGVEVIKTALSCV